MQGILGVPTLSGLGYDQTTEAELEIERFIDIFLLSSKISLPTIPMSAAPYSTYVGTSEPRMSKKRT